MVDYLFSLGLTIESAEGVLEVIGSLHDMILLIFILVMRCKKI